MRHFLLQNNAFDQLKIKGLREARSLRGFTLIELLVVIVIVGILGAIALPSFLTQIARARGTEAKSIHGSINRSQIGHRLETGTFAADLDQLDVKITNSSRFRYAVQEASGLHAIHQTTRVGEPTLDYESGIALQADGQFFTLLCEGELLGTGSDAIGATNVLYDAATLPQLSCSDGREVQ